MRSILIVMAPGSNVFLFNMMTSWRWWYTWKASWRKVRSQWPPHLASSWRGEVAGEVAGSTEVAGEVASGTDVAEVVGRSEVAF